MLPRDGVVPGPQRSIAELTQVGLRHVHRLRVRRRVQTAIAVGVTVALAATTIPLLLRSTSIGDIENIAPVEEPDRRPDDRSVRTRTGDSPRSQRVERGGPAGADPEGPGGPSMRGGSSSARVPYVPDERIAFASFRDDNNSAEIYTMQPDGDDVSRLTNDAASNSQPTWSPDGRQIAFTSGAYRPADGAHDVFIADADGGEIERLSSTSTHESDPAWSPDGLKLVFSRMATGAGQVEYSDLYTVDLSTGETRRLTRTAQVDERGATWSPDGTKIAFQRIDWSQDNFEHGIYVIDADGSGLRRLTEEQDFTPSWSPDGRRIVFARRANLGGTAPGGVNTTPADSSSLFVINADGTSLRRVTNDSSVVDFAPDWSPDGDEIVFTRDPDGSQDAYATFEFATGTRGGPLASIYVVGADGSGIQELTEPTSGDVYADWYGPPA